jgi:hypothetical protein
MAAFHVAVSVSLTLALAVGDQHVSAAVEPAASPHHTLRIQRAVRRAYDRHNPISVSLNSGSHHSGLVVQLDARGFNIWDPTANAARYIEYRQVASTSNNRKIWIGAVAAAAAVVVVWWLYQKCFYRC